KQKHNEGLLYFLLGYDGTILYTGSSKDLSNNRLLQSDRRRGPYDSNHIPAIPFGSDFGKNIYYAVKLKINIFFTTYKRAFIMILIIVKSYKNHKRSIVLIRKIKFII
ncbi:hypothetical protein, partial [Clostridium butyricum]|uniref:hypothetical protein n=1 Tax=Clostridium butyricum TaxID=1492 RepID=UPI0021024B48